MVRASDIHIDPKFVRSAAASPRMLELRSAVRERFHLSDEGARSFAERVLTNAVERFGVKYINEMTAHIEQAFKLREQAAGILDQVLGPEAMSPDAAAGRLEGLFREIKSNIDAITGPEAFAKAQPDAALVDIVFSGEDDLPPEVREDPRKLKSARRPKSPRTGVYRERVDLLSKQLKRMPEPERLAVGRAAKLAPRELWKAVSSEIGPDRPGLPGGVLEDNITALLKRARAEGMSPGEVEALERAVRALQKERGKNFLRGAGSTEAVLRTTGVEKLVTRLEEALAQDKGFAESLKLNKLGEKALREHLTRLQQLIAGDRYLELLAAENPKQLLEMFEKSGAKSKRSLRARVRHLMVTHVRGLLGEFTAAFALGDEGIVLLKAPDDNVTIPGTDLVGVTQGGRIWLIDNKALSGDEVESVTSLTSNISKNIADDAENIAADLTKAAQKTGTPTDPLVEAAVLRLERAKKAIQKVTQGMSPKEVSAPAIQRRITEICARNKIDRVVTNAGGAVRGLQEALRKAGLLLKNVNNR